MRLFGWALCIFFVLMPFVHAQEEPSSKFVFQLNENVGVWSGSSSPKKEGGLNFTYFSLGYIRPNWGVMALSSWADISYVGNGGTSGDLNKTSFLDSSLIGHYVFKNVSGFDIRTGLDINLPTGYTNYKEDEYNAVAAFSDNFYKDINIATSLGAGLNWAPNVVISRIFMKRMVVGMGGRYERTGEYDISTSTQNYDPGDLLTFIASLQLMLNKSSLLFFDTSATYASRDTQNGTEISKAGDTYRFSLKYIRSFERIRAALGASFGIQMKNQQYESATSQIVSEESNSNNNDYAIFLNLNYMRSKKLIFNGIAGYKNVIENGYGADDAYYDAGYSKVYGGGGVTYIFSKRLFFSADLRGFQLANRADASEATDTAYRGFNLDVGFVYTLPR